MDEMQTLLDLDLRAVALGIVGILVVMVLILSKLDFLKKFFGIKTKSDIQHELLIQTSQKLAELQNQHIRDMEEFRNKQNENATQSIKHDELIRNELSSFIDEMRSSIVSLTQQMNQYSENRVHDREQSLEIQRQLNERSDDRDQKIEALMLGSMELLGDKIDQRFSRYVSLGGIPENEVDEFDGIFAAYTALKGNHKREAKYKYVKSHMKVIPVEAKIKIDE